MRRLPTIVAVLLALAGVLARPGLADQSDPRLDDLFERLQLSRSEPEADRLERSIWSIWVQSDSSLVGTLMREGIIAMGQRRLERALERFDKVVQYAPNFAEGWNKRATVHYLMRNYEKSVRDIERTLELEPRHFGALAGLGLIYDALDQNEPALRAMEAALEINPHLDGVRDRVEELREVVGGRRT